jgi:hypothetical protein
MNVPPACQSWIGSHAKADSLWTEQTPASVPVTSLSPVCSLSNDGGAVTASVVDAGEQLAGQEACNSLIATGWSSSPAPSSPPVTSVAPTGSTKLELPQAPGNSYPRVEPGSLAFSGDGGNVVTDIVWTKWSEAEAVGEGSSDLQNCVPGCAEGTQVPVDATMVLLDPVSGHFTRLLEERNGTTEIASYGAKGNSTSLTVGLWPSAVQ